MTHAYSEMYLEDAMRTLGEAVDFALCDQGLTPAELTAILSNAFEMKQFERGMSRVVCGMAGDELARDIIAHAGLTPVECRETYPFDRSPQYWAAGFWPIHNGCAAWALMSYSKSPRSIGSSARIIRSTRPPKINSPRLSSKNGTTPRQTKRASRRHERLPD